MSDLESSEVVVQGDTPSSSSREREGLPASYRMRADAHYVDQLGGRRPERAERERADVRPYPTADAGDVGADAEARERRGDRILQQLQEELATLASASAMLSQTSPLARRLGTDLVRVETWRASWLVKAHTMIDGRERAYPRPKAIGPFAEQIRAGLTPECRLAGVTLQVVASDWGATVSLDEAVLGAGITGAVLALLGSIGQDGGTIRVSFDVVGGDLRSVDVSAEDLTAGLSTTARFFDLTWTDRPGGWMAALAAATARTAAQQHGGTASLQAGDRRGCSIRFSFSKLH